MKNSILRTLLCILLLSCMLLLCACPGGEPPVTPPDPDDPPAGGLPPADTTFGEGADIENAGDSIAADAAILTPATYDESVAEEVVAGNFIRVVVNKFGAGKVFKTTGNNAARAAAQENKTFDGKGSVLLLPNGFDIAQPLNVTFKDMTIIGNVSITGANELYFENVEIRGNITVDADSTGVVFNNCRLTGETALTLAGSTHGLINSYVGFTACGLADNAVDTVVKNCRFEGAGTAIRSAAVGSSYTYSTMTLAKGDVGVSFVGAQNAVAGMNIIRGAQSSVTLSGARNTVVVRNSLISVAAEDNHAIYVCDNAMGGRLTARNNDYILADGNTYPDDGINHAAVLENNDHDSGDTLLDVDARLEVGADENLLPQVDKDLFVGMERKSTVREEGVEEEVGAYEYILKYAEAGDVVIVTPGAYAIRARADFVKKHANTTVYAYGVLIEAALVSGGNYTGGHLTFTSTENITIKGLTVGQAQQSCGQVYVLEKMAGTQLRVVTGAGMINEFGDSNANYYNTTGIGIQRAGTFYAIGDFAIKDRSIQKNKDGTMYLKVNQEVYDLLRPGDVLTCRQNGGGRTAFVTSSANITYKDMTVYGYTGSFAFNESYNLTATTYYRVYNTTQNGPVIEKDIYDRYLAYETKYGVDLEISEEMVDGKPRYRGSLPHIGSVDATHTSYCAEGSQVISCLFENMCDDGTNQNSGHARLSALIDNGDGTTTIVYKGNLSASSYSSSTDRETLSFSRYCADFREGDRVFIYTSAGQLVCDTKALSATEWYDQITVNHPDPVLKGKTTHRYAVKVSTDKIHSDALEGFDLTDDNHVADEKVLVDNRSLASNNFHFDNMVVQNVRSRGLLIKASEGVVEHCTFRNIAKVAVAIIYEIQWGESGVSENVTVRNNLIDHTSYSPGGGIQNGIGYVHVPIDIIGMGGEVVDENFMMYKNIEISGNKFINRVIDWSPYAIYIQAACNVRILNNDFGSEETDFFKALWVSGVRDIELSGNQYPPEIQYQFEYYVEGEHYQNIHGDDVLTFIPDKA